MLYFHWKIIDSILKKLQGILHTIKLAPLLFFKWSWWKVASIICKLILIISDNKFIIISNIYVSINVLSIHFYWVYNKYFIMCTRSVGMRCVLANCCISGPESVLYYYCFFKVFLSMIGIDEFNKLCWKTFKKGRYICHSMSASQHKSGKIQKYTFISLLHNFSWYTFCGCFC